MWGGEDWMMRPVLRNLCKYESLVTPGLGLVDFLIMNEALDVEAENRNRLIEKEKASCRR